MIEKLQSIEDRYNEIIKLLSDPEIISNQTEYQKYTRELSQLEEVVNKYRDYKKIEEEIAGVQDMLEEGSDQELKEMAQDELEQLKDREEELIRQLKVALLPKDPHDERNTIVEIRAGTGGGEAALFAADLFRMYSYYAERMRWKIEVLNSNPTGIGGFKEIIFLVEGKGAYSRLKFESGVHRVQRVPATESSGRIHTSAASVVVLPEAEEVEVDIDPKDLKIDIFHSSGPGGQCVNKTASAVRITHLPSGIVVSCQDERSQLKNKARVMQVLRSRLLAVKEAEQHEKITEEKRSQIKSGDRSEKIRTYNFPQNRVTDHRINLTLYRLESILNGDIDELIDSLRAADQAEKLGQAA